MSVSDEVDRSLVEFAQKIAAIPKGIADEDRSEELRPKASDASIPAAAEAGGRSSPPPLPGGEPSAPDIPPTPPVATNSKHLRSADEIAGIIMKSLRTIEGCPVSGFSVTVYGSNPWNAMLTIRPEAGPRVNRELWCARVHDIGVQLRNEFDVADASTNGSA